MSWKTLHPARARASRSRPCCRPAAATRARRKRQSRPTASPPPGRCAATADAGRRSGRCRRPRRRHDRCAGARDARRRPGHSRRGARRQPRVSTIPARERRLDVVRAYVGLGLEHMLSGLDHLLFVAGLVLLARGGWLLVETIAAFAVGHSLTLALAAFDLLRLPARPTELLIALSVFVLAAELAREPEATVHVAAAPPRLGRWRSASACCTGCGFAAALARGRSAAIRAAARARRRSISASSSASSRSSPRSSPPPPACAGRRSRGRAGRRRFRSTSWDRWLRSGASSAPRRCCPSDRRRADAVRLCTAPRRAETAATILAAGSSLAIGKGVAPAHESGHSLPGAAAIHRVCRAPHERAGAGQRPDHPARRPGPRYASTPTWQATPVPPRPQ